MKHVKDNHWTLDSTAYSSLVSIPIIINNNLAKDFKKKSRYTKVNNLRHVFYLYLMLLSPTQTFQTNSIEKTKMEKGLK